MAPVFVSSTHGVRIAVHPLNAAPDDAPVLVFCHALGFCAPMYAPLARALAPHVRCLGIDLRYHGASTSPSEPTFHWREFGDDVLAVIDSSLVPSGVALHGFGHSLGGAALTLAAARRPGRFASLYLYEPVIPPPNVIPGFGARNAMAEMAEKRRARFESREAAHANFRAKPPFALFDAEALAAYVDDALEVEADGSTSLRCKPLWEASLYRTAGESGAFEVAPTIATRVRLAMGKQGPDGPGAFAPVVAARLGAGEPRRFEAYGHFGPFDAPATIAADVAEFLGVSVG